MTISFYDLIACMNLLTIIFIVLKCIGVIRWSWWWVYAPVWLPIAIIVLCLIF